MGASWEGASPDCVSCIQQLMAAVVRAAIFQTLRMSIHRSIFSKHNATRTRSRNITAATLALSLVGGATLPAATGNIAHAAPPSAPDNILVFPNRDFVTIEGFQNHVGETATVEVLRGGVIMGSASATIAAGDVAFEINHPGGVCWGAGGGLQVTPDIQAGDLVQIRIGGAVLADTLVLDAAVDSVPTLVGNTLTVTGHVRGNIDPTFLEQRTINPDLVGTEVGRRDIRAAPGPLTPAPKGGYQSSLVINGTTATATYVFDNVATAQLVAGGGGERMMAWQVQDPAGNRQGLTIAELGEVGGPGVGGCPLGPGQASAPQPGAAAAVRSADKTSMVVTWTPATAVPGAANVTNYSVLAISTTQTSQGATQLGVRTGATATSATISGLTPAIDYSAEVRAIAGTSMGSPLTIALPATSAPQQAQFAAPTASSSSAGVALATTRALAEIYYTLDGSAPRTADMPSATALLYRAPIVIPADNTTLKAFAVDIDGATSTTFSQVFSKTTVALPNAPTNVTAAPGDASATVNWAAAAGGVAATAWRVTATPVAPSTSPIVTQEAPVGARSLVITRLVNNVNYNITVAGLLNGVAGASSAAAAVRPVASTTDTLIVTGATWKSGDFRVDGTGSVTGASITLFTVNANNTIGTAIPGATTTVAAPVPPALAGAWQVRLRNGAAGTANPGRIYVRSDRGGVIGPITVTNK